MCWASSKLFSLYRQILTTVLPDLEISNDVTNETDRRYRGEQRKVRVTSNLTNVASRYLTWIKILEYPTLVSLQKLWTSENFDAQKRRDDDSLTFEKIQVIGRPWSNSFFDCLYFLMSPHRDALPALHYVDSTAIVRSHVSRTGAMTDPMLRFDPWAAPATLVVWTSWPD
jgi:hypothetical protein